YNERRILKDGVVPVELINSSKTLRPQCMGYRPPHGAWCHITGVDLIRDQDGQMYVLEDNLRCPSGVSYVLENRELMKRTFPQVFQGMSIAPIEEYSEQLLQTLLDCAPTGMDNPTAVVLTPGIYNSAYFEHTFLAQQMGVELVQGSDLVVDGNFVYMSTTRGYKQVDVIYRRIDDDFLDPKCFRADSSLGVEGLMDVCRAGNVTLANAPGTGIADDKAVYAYVPQIIKYYLGEEAIIPNVPTFLCDDEKQCQHVLQNLDKLVVKPTNESGGYGILMGPHSTPEEQQKCAEQIRKNPREWIAQPMLNLSTVPTLIGDQLEPRHVDLRPFVLSGRETYVMPGGLTRVALKAGSMIVNSSQGGGSKDTWVLRDTAMQEPNSQTAVRETV
ncbi:MAG: putative circularly permuted ATP-grasp superfamily protein, partial [Pirellulaceae bacterium]